MVVDNQTLRMPANIGASKQASFQSFWRRTVAVSAALFSAVVVKLTCPACWSTYAALLGTSGVAGFASIPYLFPLTLLACFLSSHPSRTKPRNGEDTGR